MAVWTGEWGCIVVERMQCHTTTAALSCGMAMCCADNDMSRHLRQRCEWTVLLRRQCSQPVPGIRKGRPEAGPCRKTSGRHCTAVAGSQAVSTAQLPMAYSIMLQDEITNRKDAHFGHVNKVKRAAGSVHDECCKQSPYGLGARQHMWSAVTGDEHSGPFCTPHALHGKRLHVDCYDCPTATRQRLGLPRRPPIAGITPWGCGCG